MHSSYNTVLSPLSPIVDSEITAANRLVIDDGGDETNNNNDNFMPFNPSITDDEYNSSTTYLSPEKLGLSARLTCACECVRMTEIL
jgi:hypothetical protein